MIVRANARALKLTSGSRPGRSRASMRSAALAHPCASRAGDFLVATRKYPKKGFLSLAGRNPSGSPRSSPHRGCATRNATVDGVTQTVLAHLPRWGCSARRALRGLHQTRTNTNQTNPYTWGAAALSKHLALPCAQCRGVLRRILSPDRPAAGIRHNDSTLKSLPSYRGLLAVALFSLARRRKVW